MRGSAALLMFVLVGCGAPADSSVDPAPLGAVAPSRAAGETPAAVTVGGRLRAHDGGPLRAGEFTVLRNGFVEPTARGNLAEDGSFRVEVEPGIYAVSIAAVDHAQVVRSVLVERAIDVRGQLGTYSRAVAGERLQVKMEMFGVDGVSIASGPGVAVRGVDGVYRLDLADRPKHAVKLRYQIDSGSGRTYNGPLADSYESDGGGDYWSVVAIQGRDAIELDLAAMPPAGEPALLTWSGEAPELVEVWAYQDRWEPRVRLLRDGMALKDGGVLDPSEQESGQMAALAAEALAEADAAGSDEARMLLRLAHLDLFTGHDDDAAALTRAGWVLEHVDPVDRRLALFMNVNSLLFRALASADAAFAARMEAWLDRMQGNPDPSTVLAAIYFLMLRADERSDDMRVAELYAAGSERRFAGMYRSKDLAQRFAPDRILQRGEPFPGFEFPALAGGGPAVTQAERAGRVYFVEFWATWCGPCVAEMAFLHAAYAKINDASPGQGKDGLRRLGVVERPKIEFVFVSLDLSPTDVQEFRKKHWAMPWTHAFVGRTGGEKEVMARYGFSGVPTSVLVDGTGTIVEVGEALRRERLLPTLERAVAPKR